MVPENAFAFQIKRFGVFLRLWFISAIYKVTALR
ncbi:Uncharacterised protein [uncultured Bacteroides sp.]|nr:Uncharacterised protein [uncultured Bacteroides sp.]